MAAKESTHIYIGAYTGGKSQGIYRASFDQDNGKLGAPELAAETKNPTFLCLHPNGRYLYAVGEVDNFEGKKTGAVESFRIEPGTGKLTLLNRQPSEGTAPCHLALDKSGKCVLVANYGSGSIAALPVAADGTLGPARAKFQHEGSSVNKGRQSGPHAHFITPDPTEKFALTCDLGLDQVLVYKFEPAKCSLTANDPPFVPVKPGEGPRHLVFHPSLKWMYVVNEMGSSVTAFEYDANRGPGKEFQMISTTPADFKAHNSGAEIQMHPSGRFLYASNRGDNSIALFSINPKDGRLILVSHQSTEGKTPRHFAIDPSGKWIVAENQDSDNVVVLGLDEKSGKLRSTGESIEVGKPVCVIFAK